MWTGRYLRVGLTSYQAIAPKPDWHNNVNLGGVLVELRNKRYKTNSNGNLFVSYLLRVNHRTHNIQTLFLTLHKHTSPAWVAWHHELPRSTNK